MTTRYDELNLDTMLSVAVIATGLMVSGFGYAVGTEQARAAGADRVTVSEADGHYRMTITAQRPRDFVPVRTTAQLDCPTPATT